MTDTVVYRTIFKPSGVWQYCHSRTTDCFMADKLPSVGWRPGGRSRMTGESGPQLATLIRNGGRIEGLARCRHAAGIRTGTGGAADGRAGAVPRGPGGDVAVRYRTAPVHGRHPDRPGGGRGAVPLDPLESVGTCKLPAADRLRE